MFPLPRSLVKMNVQVEMLQRKTSSHSPPNMVGALFRTGDDSNNSNRSIDLTKFNVIRVRIGVVPTQGNREKKILDLSPLILLPDLDPYLLLGIVSEWLLAPPQLFVASIHMRMTDRVEDRVHPDTLIEVDKDNPRKIEVNLVQPPVLPPLVSKCLMQTFLQSTASIMMTSQRPPPISPFHAVPLLNPNVNLVPAKNRIVHLKSHKLGIRVLPQIRTLFPLGI